MNIEEMKDLLAKKFVDEQSTFTREDINIEAKENNTYIITIRDFEELPFTLRMFVCDNEYYVTIKDSLFGEYVSFNVSKTHYDIEWSLIELGYHIAQTF